MPRFQIVFGNEAIAEWFTSKTNQMITNSYQYVQMAKRLGIEPVITPEIAESITLRKNRLVVDLVKIALEISKP